LLYVFQFLFRLKLRHCIIINRCGRVRGTERHRVGVTQRSNGAEENETPEPGLRGLPGKLSGCLGIHFPELPQRRFRAITRDVRTPGAVHYHMLASDGSRPICCFIEVTQNKA
jgi:hypothetical protein